MRRTPFRIGLVLAALPAWTLAVVGTATAGEDWTQLGFDARRSGNAAERSVSLPLGLAGAVPLTDRVLTAPVVADGRVYAVDASGVAFGIDARTLEVEWKRPTRGGGANANNVSSPAVVGEYLHFGTTAGSWWVLRLDDGSVVREIRCGEPVLASPVVANGRVYFVTLGSRAYALDPDGTVRWQWDYVTEVLGFEGDRFRGARWSEHKKGRVTTADQFLCARSPAMHDRTLVIPAGGAVVWLRDAGERPDVRAVHVPRTPALGLSLGASGAVYRQWHFLDNRGSVEVLRLRDGEVERDHVPGTETSTRSGALSFSAVAIRGGDVYRSRPEEGAGLCRHRPGRPRAEPLGGSPSVASPVLLRDYVVQGGLDGRLHVVPLSGEGPPASFRTAFGRAITAPVAVSDGRIYFGCDDGYLYALGPDGDASLPAERLDLWRIRSPLTSGREGAEHDWFTSFGDFSNTNRCDEPVEPPFRLKWVRRFAGSTKHASTCGGGRLYTHTAEGQMFAVEQETGRLLWRRYFPGVHISYTSPLYHEGRVLVPQAGPGLCRLRCFDAATGELRWEAPFSGSPSWNRQQPPVVHEGLAIYAFSTGYYTREEWLTAHGEIDGFPEDQNPLVRAWDIETGEEVWTADFSEHGTGGDDAGLCLLDGTLYYSCFFGYSRREAPEASRALGVTAALDPETGRVLWTTTEHAVHSGCTISGEDGRLYLGGYSRVDARGNRVWCLDARDGSLVWESGPVKRAIHVITVGDRFLFTHAQYENGYLIDKTDGEIIRTLTEGYKCTRFTLAGTCLLGANLDVHDLSDPEAIELLRTGPAVDPSLCVGAIASNGRIFYTGHGSGLQLSLTYGGEAETTAAPWEAGPPAGEDPGEGESSGP